MVKTFKGNLFNHCISLESPSNAEQINTLRHIPILYYKNVMLLLKGRFSEFTGIYQNIYSYYIVGQYFLYQTALILLTTEKPGDLESISEIVGKTFLGPSPIHKYVSVSII